MRDVNLCFIISQFLPRNCLYIIFKTIDNHVQFSSNMRVNFCSFFSFILYCSSLKDKIFFYLRISSFAILNQLYFIVYLSWKRFFRLAINLYLLRYWSNIEWIKRKNDTGSIKGARKIYEPYRIHVTRKTSRTWYINTSSPGSVWNFCRRFIKSANSAEPLRCKCSGYILLVAPVGLHCSIFSKRTSNPGTSS